MAMTQEQAWTKYNALLRMTVDRGCTTHEAATAARIAAALAARFGFGDTQPKSHHRPEWDDRFARAEKRAAIKWRWEYRRCGKGNCHCARGGRHGPYKYGKKRKGRKVVSIYVGM